MSAVAAFGSLSCLNGHERPLLAFSISRFFAGLDGLFEAFLLEVKLLEHQGIPVLGREASQIAGGTGARLPGDRGLRGVNLEESSIDPIYTEKHRGHP